MKKNKKILFFCVIFADLIRIVYVMKVCEAEIRHFILRISVRIKGSEQNVIYLCTDRQRIIKISANFKNSYVADAKKGRNSRKKTVSAFCFQKRYC